eukprot:UN17850
MIKTRRKPIDQTNNEEENRPKPYRRAHHTKQRMTCLIVLRYS